MYKIVLSEEEIVRVYANRLIEAVRKDFKEKKNETVQ